MSVYSPPPVVYPSIRRTPHHSEFANPRKKLKFNGIYALQREVIRHRMSYLGVVNLMVVEELSPSPLVVRY